MAKDKLYWKGPGVLELGKGKSLKKGKVIPDSVSAKEKEAWLADGRAVAEPLSPDEGGQENELAKFKIQIEKLKKDKAALNEKNGELAAKLEPVQELQAANVELKAQVEKLDTAGKELTERFTSLEKSYAESVLKVEELEAAAQAVKDGKK